LRSPRNSFTCCRSASSSARKSSRIRFSNRAGAGHERPDLVEIAKRLVRLCGVAAACAERDHGAVDGLAQAMIEQGGCA
jgi:hypothetical protein